MVFKEAAVDYLNRVVRTEEFVIAGHTRVRTNVGVLIFGNYDVIALIEDLECTNLSERIESLEGRLSSTDPKIVGDTVMTWLKEYTPQETAQVLGVSEQDVLEIRREFALMSRSQPIKKYNLRNHLRDYLQKQKEEYSPENPLRVMMGTTPSGPLHIANMFTLATGAVNVQQAVEQAGIRDVRYILGYNDLFALMRGHSNEDIEERKRVVEEFIGEMQRGYGIEICLEPFSELQRTDAFRETLEEVARRRLFPGGSVRGVAGEILVAERNTGNFRYIHGNMNRETFTDDTVDYVPHTLLDLMAFRDAADKVDVHILGGDQTHAGKIRDPGRYVGGKNIALYVPGIVFGSDGREMHVSNGNAISLDEIKGVSGWLEKIVELGNAPTRLIGQVEYRSLIPSGTRLYGIL